MRSKHLTLPTDIHSLAVQKVKRPAKVSITGRRLFGFVSNFQYREGFHYRIMRDKRSAMRGVRWLVVECKNWSREHLNAVKDAIIKQGMCGVDRTLKVGEDVIRFYRQTDLSLRQVEYPSTPGLYVTTYTKLKGAVALDPNGSCIDFLVIG